MSQPEEVKRSGLAPSSTKKDNIKYCTDSMTSNNTGRITSETVRMISGFGSNNAGIGSMALDASSKTSKLVT